MISLVSERIWVKHFNVVLQLSLARYSWKDGVYLFDVYQHEDTGQTFNPLLRQVSRERMREAHDRSLGRDVAGHRRALAERRHARRVDDARALGQVRQGERSHRERPKDFAADHARELVKIDIRRFLGHHLHSRVISKQVHLPELGDVSVDGPIRVLNAVGDPF